MSRGVLCIRGNGVGRRHRTGRPDAEPHSPSRWYGFGPPQMSLFRINVRSSSQHKCHSVMPRWYQMMMS